MPTQVVLYHLCCFRLDTSIFPNAIQQIGRTDVGSHDQNRILEVNGTSLRIRDPAIIQYL